jgi:hypothetical protein
MRRGLTFPALLTMAALGLSAPPAGAAVTTRAEGDFTLLRLRGKPVAAWPIPVLALDEATARMVMEARTSHDALLDRFGDAVSAGLLKWCKAGSLGSGEVARIFSGDPAARSLLDTEALLGPAGTSNRFLPRAPPQLGGLAGQPGLKGLSYALVFRDLGLGGQVATPAGAVAGVTSAGGQAAGEAIAGGFTDSTRTHARLRFSVVDLQAARVVWEGALVAETGNYRDAADTFRELGEGLARDLLVELGVAAPIKPTRWP